MIFKMNNKFKLLILAITMLIGVMLPASNIKAVMHHDYKHIDDINYISVIHHFDNNMYYTEWGHFAEASFKISFTDNTNIYGLPNVFETTSQVGSFNMYFNSNLSISEFTTDISDYALTIRNNTGFSYNYYPYDININQVGSVYHLNAEFESGIIQELDIASNTWYFDFFIIGDYSTGDYVNMYAFNGDNLSSFSWYYYKDPDNMLSDYERGWVDGYGAGFDNWYEGRYQLGFDDGYVAGRAEYGKYFPPGSPDGFNGWYGFQDGYDYGLDEGYTNGLRDGEVDEVIAKMDQWIVPAIILVLIGGGFIAFAKYRGSKNE